MVVVVVEEEEEEGEKEEEEKEEEEENNFIRQIIQKTGHLFYTSSYSELCIYLCI